MAGLSAGPFCFTLLLLLPGEVLLPRYFLLGLACDVVQRTKRIDCILKTADPSRYVGCVDAPNRVVFRPFITDEFAHNACFVFRLVLPARRHFLDKTVHHLLPIGSSGQAAKNKTIARSRPKAAIPEPVFPIIKCELAVRRGITGAAVRLLGSGKGCHARIEHEKESRCAQNRYGHAANSGKTEGFFRHFAEFTNRV